jgi:hypothetical protein
MSAAMDALTREAATLAAVLHQEQIAQLSKGLYAAEQAMGIAEKVRRETVAHARREAQPEAL